MLPKRQDTPKAVQFLPSGPTLSAVRQVLSQALENLDQQIEVFWTSTDRSVEYRLTVRSDPMGGDPKWQLSSGTGRQTEPLWVFACCDALLVYNRISSSLGQPSVPMQEKLFEGSPIAESDSDALYYQPPSTIDDQKTSTMTLPIVSTDGVWPRSTTALNGDLAFIQISALLQSISLAKMTGKLEIDSNLGPAEVFFEEGKPVHATTPDTIGDESILELVTWKEGRFYFQPKVTSPKTTCKGNLDNLIIQGVHLLDKQNYLKNAGMRPESVLVRTRRDIFGKELEQMLLTGAPVSLELQKQFYEAIDDRTPVAKLVEKLGLSRKDWVLIVCNMITCGLAVLSDDASRGRGGRPPLEPKSVDSAAIQAVMMSLRRADTGMFNFAAFLYFLEQEYFRGHRAGSPLSVIIFDLRVKSGMQEVIREPLPSMALREAVLRINQVKRHNDLLAHYESFEYALLCPETKGEGARTFAARIVHALTMTPLAPGVEPRKLSLAFGIACIPEDFMELSLLLSAAEEAKNTAMVGNNPVVLYRDLA